MKPLRILIFSFLNYGIYELLRFVSEVIGLSNASVITGIIILTISIVVTLFLCKWYFRYVPPTIREGTILGGFSAILFLLIMWGFDGFSIENSLDSFSLLMAIEILIVSIYSGFEFDATFTKSSEKKELTK